MKYTTYGYRARRDRFYVVFLGLVFLAMMNILFLAQIDALLIVAMIISGRFLYRKISVLKNTSYTFKEDAVVINTRKGKTYTIPLADIAKTTLLRNVRLPRHGTTMRNTINYATSYQRMLELELKEGPRIYISPKTIKPRVRKTFKIKEASKNQKNSKEK